MYADYCTPTIERRHFHESNNDIPLSLPTLADHTTFDNPERSNKQ